MKGWILIVGAAAYHASMAENLSPGSGRLSAFLSLWEPGNGNLKTDDNPGITGMEYPRFHLALPVDNLTTSAKFYEEVLACTRGRESSRWIDFDFWGHQLVVHLVSPDSISSIATNPVDGENVPASHFGPILAWEDFDALVSRLREKKVPFVIEPVTRFAGKRGEQRTLFVKDPSGNHLEFKSFRNIDMLFASDGLDYP